MIIGRAKSHKSGFCNLVKNGWTIQLKPFQTLFLYLTHRKCIDLKLQSLIYASCKDSDCYLIIAVTLFGKLYMGIIKIVEIMFFNY